jgi:hypothetical protein
MVPMLLRMNCCFLLFVAASVWRTARVVFEFVGHRLGTVNGACTHGYITGRSSSLVCGVASLATSTLECAFCEVQVLVAEDSLVISSSTALADLAAAAATGIKPFGAALDEWSGHIVEAAFARQSANLACFLVSEAQQAAARQST